MNDQCPTALSRFYIDFDDFNAADTREAYAWGQLRSIASSEVPPDSNDLTRLRSALQEAKTADWIVRSDTRELVRRARQSDLKPGKLSTQPDQTCVPATTPHDRAEAIVESAGDISWD